MENLLISGDLAGPQAPDYPASTQIKGSIS